MSVSLTPNEQQCFSYLQRQSREFLQADSRYSNLLLQKIADVHRSPQSLNTDLPRVEVQAGSPLVENFDKKKLESFLKKLQLTVNGPNYVSLGICSDTQARRIASVVCSILRNSSFTENLGHAHSSSSLLARWISIKDLMGLVVLASATRGLFFADCSQYESHLELDAPLQ